MDAREVDKKAVREKFIAEIAEHTLSEANGYATNYVIDQLRSDYVVSHWVTELVRLQAKTPHGSPFWKKLNARLCEARRLEKESKARIHKENQIKLARERDDRKKKHEEMLTQKAAEKKDPKKTSPVNIAQMAAQILGAYIIAGKHQGAATISASVKDAIALVHEVET